MNKMTRYIQIAALLPSKCVRDVALRIVREENIPTVATNNGGLVDLPQGISVVTDEQHQWINKTLNDNVALINTLRDNLVQQRAHQNMKLYENFRSQAKLVQDFLSGLPIQLPEPNFAISTLFTDDNKGNEKGRPVVTNQYNGQNNNAAQNSSAVADSTSSSSSSSASSSTAATTAPTATANTSKRTKQQPTAAANNEDPPKKGRRDKKAMTIDTNSK
jgi:hypothetical protein